MAETRWFWICWNFVPFMYQAVSLHKNNVVPFLCAALSSAVGERPPLCVALHCAVLPGCRSTAAAVQLKSFNDQDRSSKRSARRQPNLCGGLLQAHSQSVLVSLPLLAIAMAFLACMSCPVMSSPPHLGGGLLRVGLRPAVELPVALVALDVKVLGLELGQLVGAELHGPRLAAERQDLQLAARQRQRQQQYAVG